jgi:hypothetical protein
MEKDMGVTPLALKKRVKLRKDCRKYKDAFRDISAQRPFNQAGVQSIPITEITGYLDGICERRPEQRRVFIRMMLDMDAVFMEYIRKKTKKD